MVEHKARYYANLMGEDFEVYAPTGNVYPQEILNIPDDDPDFLLWKETTEATKELVELDGVLSRAEEDIVNTLINRGVITGNEPKMAYIMENITRKVAARNRL